MADTFTPEQRSRLMARVKGRDTKPERIVRSLLHRLGYRFRLHRKDLPGKPDIVLPKHGKVVYVHGCFWHGHPACPRAARPTSNVEFWNTKLDGNIARDTAAQKALVKLGWRYLVVWQCETRDPRELTRKLVNFLR
ncbi:MAG: mismatch endonuclease, patch repair protein [Acidobacteriota bacterium]|jgi:DNA mismatch endonuclease (patch repair protein)|nr:mismatch endonuclease, patch repair protein [Acidobacteriota bacterium]